MSPPPPPRRFIYRLIVLSVLMAGALLGHWLLPAAGPGDWPPTRWLMIAGCAGGALGFAAWMRVLFMMGLMRLQDSPHAPTLGGVILLIPMCLFVFLIQVATIAGVLVGIAFYVRLLIGWRT